MISRRNYVIILIVMGIIFFLFQFSQIIRDYGNDYTYNEYADKRVPDRNEWKQQRIESTEDLVARNDKDYILFIGNNDTNAGMIVSQWTLYSKRDQITLDSISKFPIDRASRPEFVLVDSNYVDFAQETAIFEQLTQNGVSIVFLNLPDWSVISAVDGLSDLLGISYLYEETINAEGIKLFAGFLLGGETIYEPEKPEEERRQDLELSMPWYITAGGTKTYMVGIMDDYYDDYTYKNDYFPAIIWRNSFGEAQVFCVNGDFMSGTAGLGILSAMIYELSDYQLYPVVNAQNTLVVDFPLMSNENDAEFNKIYSRSINSFQTDVIWPTLISLAEKDDIRYTCFMSPKYNYSDPSEPSYDDYTILLKLFSERDAEVGISLEHADGIDLPGKLAYDKDYYDGLENRYPSTAAFMDLKDVDDLDEALNNDYLAGVRTIACDENINLPILSYLTDDITLQSLTSNTKNFTYSKDLMLKSIETVLGYDNAKLNMCDVEWPESDDDHWENIYNDMSSSLKTFWIPFRVFDRTTLSESDFRVRTFLNLYSESERDGDTITLNVSGTNGETSYFILRTHGEKIESMIGATYSDIEEDAYLLELISDKVTIKLKDADAIN